MGQISLNSAANEQGVTMGVAQSAATVSRCIGPPIATTLYFVQTPLPYLMAAGIAVVAAMLAWLYLPKGHQTLRKLRLKRSVNAAAKSK